MSRDALTGSRIRERRVIAGTKQADLARQIGISASYLNLIEHNRRRIGGKLLLNISQALGVEPQALTEGAEATLIAALRGAAQEAGLAGEEAARADEFAGRFPGWADVLAATRARVASLEHTVEALSDRLAHDPHLASSMHELLTTAAAVRSTASILAQNATLEPEWRNRFHANINEDSRRLADSAQALVAYLDVSDAAPDSGASPQEEVEAFVTAHGFFFPQIEAGDKATGGDTIDALIAQAPQLKTASARHIARGTLSQIATDAAALPLDVVRKAGQAQGMDPARIAQVLSQPMPRVLRRMASLAELGAGLVVCDRSGTVIFRKSVEGFIVPRHGACCPLWPLFGTLAQPGAILREDIAQLGRGQTPFTAYASAETIQTAEYNAIPMIQAVMLLIPATEGRTEARDVGATCRICAHEACLARREPSILT